MRSFSYAMEYVDGHHGGDQLGGLPSHDPYNWPRCQSCQSEMAFVGQLYACEWFPISGLFCLQFYMCVERCDLDRSFIQLERVHHGAKRNRRAVGRSHPEQPLKTIRYFEIEDSIDQMSFTKQQLSEGELPDTHLRNDKLGGLFPYDGYEGPEITADNRYIGQMKWDAIPEMLYLCESRTRGPYFFLYR